MSEIKHTITPQPSKHTFSRNVDAFGGFLPERHVATVDAARTFPIEIDGVRFTLESLEEILTVARGELAETTKSEG